MACLTAADDQPPVRVFNADGSSKFLLVADHAGNSIPGYLKDLGLDATDLSRHIAWDIGIAGVCQVLSERLDATLIAQTMSRLVIDCNRPLGSVQSIPQISDGTFVPGNAHLDLDARLHRERAIFYPYHARIAAEIDRRALAGRPTALIAMHSFTPVLGGKARPWQVGVLHRRDRRLGDALLEVLRRDPDLTVGDNEPYSISDATDWTLPVHGEQRGLLHVGIEIRQDLILRSQDQAAWGARLAQMLEAALCLVLERHVQGAHAAG